MNELQIFDNPEFGQMRMMTINNKPYFVGKDVADILGYSNSRKALADHVDEEDKIDGVTIRDSIGREQMPIFINESGFYSLVMCSKLPAAKRFKHWVTSEVLPSIRKNGGYIDKQESLSPEQLIANALVVANNILNEKQRQIDEMTPKAEFFDAVTDSKDAIPIGDVAKVLDMGVGRNKLFEILRSRKVLLKNNTPYQRYIDRGWFRTIEQKYEKAGDIHINIKTLAFQKGVDGIRKLLEEDMVEE